MSCLSQATPSVESLVESQRLLPCNVDYNHALGLPVHIATNCVFNLGMFMFGQNPKQLAWIR
jgi:hypothetical protein